MKKETYKSIWFGVQLFLFVIPVVITFIMTSYDISYNKEYV